jgi:hypothetical protein
MESLLFRYFNPDFYSPETRAEAEQGALETLEARLLLVRLALELRQKDLAMVTRALSLLEAMPLSGFRLFERITARMIASFMLDDKAAFLVAVDAWLQGYEADRANFNRCILQQPEFALWLSGAEQTRIRQALTSSDPLPLPLPLSVEDHTLVRDIDAVRLAAVNENLEWLQREVSIFGSPELLAREYRLHSVNHSLREASFVAAADIPGITVVLDPQGNVEGSFLSH